MGRGLEYLSVKPSLRCARQVNECRVKKKSVILSQFNAALQEKLTSN